MLKLSGRSLPGAPVGRTTSRQDLVTILLSVWLIAGLFLDGYAHEELIDGSESFLTPWHGVFYSGFAATAIWVWFLGSRAGATGVTRIGPPPGYERATLGLVLFAAGGIGDAAWHSALGVETGIDALLSPTHLVLFVGLMLILLSPWRAGIAAGDGRTTAAWSMALAVALAGFFTNYVWGLGIGELAATRYDPASQVGEVEVIAGIGSVLVTTAVLFGPAALMLRRLEPPVWWFTVMFGLVALLVAAAFDEGWEGVMAATIGGAVLDGLRRAPNGGMPHHANALAVAAGVMWSAFFVMVALGDGLSWQAEIWSGSVLLAGLTAWWVGHVAARTTTPVLTEP